MMGRGDRGAWVVDAGVVLVAALVLGVLFWLGGATDPMWAVISFVLVYDPEAKSVGRVAWARLSLTVLGSALAMGVVFAVGIAKWTLPLSVTVAALVGAAFFRSRAQWRIMLVTVALIVGSSILQASAGPYIAVTRSIEVTAGSLLAVALSWGVARWRERLARD